MQWLNRKSHKLDAVCINPSLSVSACTSMIVKNFEQITSIKSDSDVETVKFL